MFFRHTDIYFCSEGEHVDITDREYIKVLLISELTFFRFSLTLNTTEEEIDTF